TGAWARMCSSSARRSFWESLRGGPLAPAAAGATAAAPASVGGGGLVGLQRLPVAGRPGESSVGGSRNAGGRLKSRQSSRFVSLASRRVSAPRLNLVSMKRSTDVWSCTLCDTNPCLLYGEITKAGTRRPYWFQAAGASGVGATAGGMSSGGTAAGGGTWS